MIKSHIFTANTPTLIDVPIGQLVNEFKIFLKCSRPISSKDVIPKKKKIQGKLVTFKDAIKIIDQSKINEPIAPKKTQIKYIALEETHIEQVAI